MDAPRIFPNTPIQFPVERSLWRVIAVDDMMQGQMRTAFLIRGAANINDAIKSARSSVGYQNFKSQFLKAEIVGAEFAGITEN